MANEGYHESNLSEETRDMHRAITSLMEELEAVDWYNQRVDACKDKDLRVILAHNRDEEKEHAAMVLEWIRRRDPRFNKELRDYLFTDKPIAAFWKRSTNPEDYFMRTETMQKLTRDQLLPLEQYARQRNDFRTKVMAHKKKSSGAGWPARDPLLRGPADHALSGTGNAARRAHFRGRGY